MGRFNNYIFGIILSNFFLIIGEIFIKQENRVFNKDYKYTFKPNVEFNTGDSFLEGVTTFLSIERLNFNHHINLNAGNPIYKTLDRVNY